SHCKPYYLPTRRSSELEALTVQNMKTGEYSIVYVGSQDIIDDWILTNPMLLSDTPPQQIQDAIDYYDWVNDKIGEVSSITGNSRSEEHTSELQSRFNLV